MQRETLAFRQKGQAMLFGLLFLAVVIMTLLILYNQGQLVQNRIQLENAADAAVYSQAKLAARNQNFIAYTNRAMVANEVSIGQMVALLSWAKHYKNAGAFANYPLYKFPVAPPSPVTFSDVLSIITLPWQIMGTVVEAPTKVMVKTWPTVVSYFNGALGVFQKMFALATLEAQVEINLNVVEDHEKDPDKPEMYTPVVGWYFFTQNALLTYFGENFSPTNLASLVGDADTDDANAEELVSDFLGDQVGELENMINNNSPGKSTSGNSSGGKNSNLNSSEEEDAAIEAYQRYAAIVNRNRESFTKDRHWDFGVGADFSFPLTLDAGIVKLTIELDLGFWAGLKNDGGTAYIGNDMEADSDIETLGWSSIDMTSFGIELYFGLFVNIEVCLPIIGCNDWTLLDIDVDIPIGFPLAGATHQLVSDATNAKKVMTDWGYPGMDDPGMYGGDSDDPLNDGAFDLFHLQGLLWGQVAPDLLPGMYGLNTANDVTDTYGAPPSYYSLGGSFQESGVGYEFAIALTKSMDDIETSDHDAIGINGDADDWDGDNIARTRFDVQTHSRAEGDDIAANYQQVIWGDDRPMMTVSAAETYFANPMQENADGSAEPASLFSPFWDARLKEPSAIAILIATGEIDWEDIFDGLGGETIEIIEWLLNAIGEKMVEAGVEYMLDQVDSPWDSVIEGPVNNAADAAKDAAVDAVVDQLEDYIP